MAAARQATWPPTASAVAARFCTRNVRHAAGDAGTAPRRRRRQLFQSAITRPKQDRPLGMQAPYPPPGKVQAPER